MLDLIPIFPPEIASKRPVIIAGPCSAETREQVLATAHELASAGVKIFRAGIWKPRTDPSAFEGVGSIGLEWLKEVKARTGMLTMTEVATRSHAEEALAAGVDYLWIGARTSANPFLMQELADAIGNINPNVPVLVKNPVNPDLELWIGALQRLNNAGIRHLGGIHRGFSVYGRHLYRNPPQWNIPIELRRRFPNLPLICDPSHIAGRRDLVGPLSQEALDRGFDGLIIECHPCPECALSDKNQQLTPDAFRELLSGLVVRDSESASESLAMLRRQIDDADTELLEILRRRMEIAREIGHYKKAHGMPVVQIDRHDEIMSKRLAEAGKAGLSEDFLRSVLSAIHGESVRVQIDVVNGKDD